MHFGRCRLHRSGRARPKLKSHEICHISCLENDLLGLFHNDSTWLFRGELKKHLKKSPSITFAYFLNVGSKEIPAHVLDSCCAISCNLCDVSLMPLHELSDLIQCDYFRSIP